MYYLDRIFKFLRQVTSCFIPSRKFRHIWTKGGFHGLYSYLIRLFSYKNEPKKFKYQLSFVLIVKNAACYMDEWINYHKLVGVDHFYIYDNESTDNLKEVLKPYIKSGLVDYVYWKGKRQQERCYNYALNKHRKETKWLGFIDDDEFVVPMKDKKITDVLKKLNIKSALSINWIFFGSNGFKKKPKGLVIEKFTKRQNKPDESLCKVIVNPRIACFMNNPHEVFCVGKNFSINEKKEIVYGIVFKYSENLIRINHYHTKSLEEYLLKKIRGDVAYGKHIASETEFYRRNCGANDYEDGNVMKKYVSQVKRMISKVKN